VTPSSCANCGLPRDWRQLRYAVVLPVEELRSRPCGCLRRSPTAEERKQGARADAAGRDACRAEAELMAAVTPQPAAPQVYEAEAGWYRLNKEMLEVLLARPTKAEALVGRLTLHLNELRTKPAVEQAKAIAFRVLAEQEENLDRLQAAGAQIVLRLHAHKTADSQFSQTRHDLLVSKDAAELLHVARLLSDDAFAAITSKITNQIDELDRQAREPVVNYQAIL